MSEENKFIRKDKDFTDLVKKAKRTSLFKNIIISLIISIIVLLGLYFLGNTIMSKNIDTETDIDSAWNQIQGANIEQNGMTFNYSPVSATVTTEFVKKVGDVPIPWGDKQKVFTIFGTSRLVTSEGPSGSGDVEDERIPLYFQGERAIEFYHPEVEYDQVFDDRDLLNQVDKNTVVELGLSFDKGYTIDQVQKIFKDQLAWYWVDTYSKKDIEDYTNINQDDRNTRDHTIIGDGAFGFQDRDHSKAKPASSFIRELEWLRKNGGDYQEGAQQIYNAIVGDGSKEVSPQDLKIIGVVVTGTPDQLKKFNEIPMIRGAILGATTNKY